MAIDNTRTCIELEGEIERNLNRTISASGTAAALSTRTCLNDAMHEIARKFRWSFLRGTDKLTLASNTVLSQIVGMWKSITNVYLVDTDGLFQPLKPMTPERLALYVSGFNTDSGIGPDNIVTSTGQPIEYFVMPSDAGASGTLDTKLQWVLYVYPKTDASYTIRIEGERYYDWLPYTFYNTGTITITGTSASVVGSGTLWDSASNAPFTGLYMWIAAETTSKKIQSTTDDTNLTLVSTHAAVSAGTAYAIKRQENFLTVSAPDLCVALGTAIGFDILREYQQASYWRNLAERYFREVKFVNIVGNKQYGRSMGYKVGGKRIGHGL